MYEIINILLLLMGAAGPTPVIGMNGTTAAFLGRSATIQAHATGGNLTVNHFARR